MKGDFSWFDHRARDNYTGVLEQQGRVRLDRDGLAAEEIARGLRSLMGRDAFGPGRVAVPAEASDSLRVVAASADGSDVFVRLLPGRAWVDGIPLILPETVTPQVTYLTPPLQDPVSPNSIAEGVRDAVILELWEDSVSAFQEPESLLEPALGGVDTTARVKVFHRLRLRRLAEDEDCATIGPSLIDDPTDRGRLTATPSPTIAITGDCPVEAGGGYTGDGHVLMTVEMAPAGPAGARFAWSRHGGGLVGRGRFDAVAEEIAITHNLPMIAAAGVEGFYLQSLSPEPETGEWRVRFQATVSFSNGVLSVTDAQGTWPAPAGETAFFRLWDGIGDVADFDNGATDLADGIRLEFDPDSGTNYREGDRWQFQARAAGTGFDPSLWPNQAPPQAILYHRAPLAILEWTDGPVDAISAPEDIEDCRDGFPPLTDPCHCCTITVGDGIRSHGDTDSIEEAIDRLPASGGRICLLPGRHETNALISDRAEITISGCGKQSQVIPRLDALDAPIFTLADSECIRIEKLDMIALDGVAVLATSSDDDALRQLTVEETRILACARAIQVEGGSETVIRDNRIRMIDKPGAGVAVYLTGEDARIEDNEIGVVPAAVTPVPPGGPDDLDNPDDPIDPCADPISILLNPGYYLLFVSFTFGFPLTSITPPPYQALGGVQIGAGAERVAVTGNRILGGAGNGITLGGSHLPPPQPEPVEPGADETGPQVISFDRSAIAFQGTAFGADGAPVEGVTIQVTASGSTTSANDRSRGDGRFQMKFPGSEPVPGPYLVDVLEPGVSISGVEVESVSESDRGIVPNLRVFLAAPQAEPQPRLGFLYQIRIEDNDISAMGLNGIGTTPSLAVLDIAPEDPQEPGTPGTPGTPNTNLNSNIDLPDAASIDASAFDGVGDAQVIERETGLREIGAEERAASRRFDLSRATVADALFALIGHPVVDLTILNNRITGNLQTPFTAAMRDYARQFGLGGISLGSVETLTIAGNRIEGNGRRHIDPVCGIFVTLGEQVEITDNLIRDNGRFVSVDAEVERGQRGGIAGIFMAVGFDDLGQDNSPASAKPALRLHNNVVHQPMGRALTVAAAGPVSINANHLTAERSGSEQLDLLAGVALVINLAGTGGLPMGGTMLQGNQIRLGNDSNAFIALALIAAGDLGLDANQIEAMQQGFGLGGQSVMLNSFVFAESIRITGNRFIERDLGQASVQVSAISLSSQMNITAMNEADHCIFAADLSARLVNGPNLILDDTRCRDAVGAAALLPNLPVQGLQGLKTRNVAPPVEELDGTALVYSQALIPGVEALRGYQITQLGRANASKSALGGVLGNEIARLEARSSSRADLLRAVEIRRGQTIRDAERLVAAGEIVSTLPPVRQPDDGLVITGRAVDATGVGLIDGEVLLADREGRAIEGVAPVRTDASGAYVLRVPEDRAERLLEQLDNEARLIIRPAEEPETTGTSELLTLDRGTLVAPEARVGSLRAFVATERLDLARTEQPLVRPELTAVARPTISSSRISPLLRESRPAVVTRVTVPPRR